LSRAEGPDQPSRLDLDKLVALAWKSQEHAYAPYSGFTVGVALLAGRKIFRGANIENASYPATICAERVAASQAVASGVRELSAMAVATSSPRAAAPCGVCRQFLSEFNPDMTIVAEGTSGERKTWRLRDLLPDPFEATDLGGFRRGPR